MLDISAVILTYNEEDNIRRCLMSLDFCQEVVVVDSGSSDNTVQIASEFTDKVLYHPIEGHGPQLNWGIDQTTYDWVLSLDADEEVSFELFESIASVAENTDCKGFYINRRIYYLQHWIKFSGWYPQYIMRLFHKKFGRCNEASIHKSISVQGKTSRLKGDILHYSYKNLAHHISKINDYTSIIAEEHYNRGRRFNPWKAIFAPPAEFLKKFILKRGFLDGYPGFAIAATSAYYSFLKQAKLYELSLMKKKEQP